MLDILRKHASSWLIKVLLGAIIISFAFFFGYNRMTRAKRGLQGLGEGEAVATVNGTDISSNEFRFFYDRNLERLKDTFKGESMSASLKKFAQTMTLQQLIQKRLMLQTASKMGVLITDEELASAIRKNPELIRDGEFDPIFYRHQYLSYFENRFGVNYEELIRQELAIEALRNLFAQIDSKPGAENGSTLWTFEVASINPAKMVEDKISKDISEAREAAGSFTTSPNDWSSLVKKNHAELKTVGPITIAERTRILEGRGTFDDFQKIFLLNEKHPVLDKPLEIGDGLYVVKFVGKKPSPVSAQKGKESDFLSSWMQGEMKTAKIKTYLQTE